MKAKALLVGILLLTAGCVGMDDPAANETDPEDNGTNASDGEALSASAANDSNQTSTENETNASLPTPVNRSVNLTASVTNGTVPLPVSFTLNATGFEANGSANWTLSFGDGNQTNGTSSNLPTSVNHTYNATGNLTAIFNVTYEDGETRNATINLTLEEGAPGLTWQTQSVGSTTPMVAGAVGTVNPPPGSNGASWTVPDGAQILYLNFTVSFQVGSQPGQAIEWNYGGNCESGGTASGMDCDYQDITAEPMSVRIEDPTTGGWDTQVWMRCDAACADSFDWEIQIAALAPPS